jgi:hypothetical protein
MQEIKNYLVLWRTRVSDGLEAGNIALSPPLVYSTCVVFPHAVEHRSLTAEASG